MIKSYTWCSLSELKVQIKESLSTWLAAAHTKQGSILEKKEKGQFFYKKAYGNDTLCLKFMKTKAIVVY